MSVPRNFASSVRLWLIAGLGLAVAVLPALAKGPEAPLRIPLASLGWQPPTANVLAGGGALNTVHFVDEHHLLVTFSVRRLMKRLPESLPGDTDRTIEAVLIELPSGKPLARTNWRVHDSGQYLWSLGQGRFLLRVRDQLTTFMPFANLGAGEPFAEQPFLRAERKIVAVLVSAERDLATVETVEQPPPAKPGDKGEPEPSSPRRTQLNFYRLLLPEDPLAQVKLQYAGVASAKGAINLSLTSAGYIEVFQESASRWLFDFDAYAGKFIELSPFDTSCRPQANFVSASEFVAFGCRGAADKLSLGGFNLRGEQMWQQNLTDVHAFPNFAYAPAGGRFALSRNLVAAGAGITVEFAPSAFTTQEVRVYQMYNGKQLLRAEATPVQREGQNYDLSPEGLALAIVHNEAIEVYRLPSLGREDVKAVQEARSLVPKDTKMAVTLASHRKPEPAKVATVVVVGAPTPAPGALSEPALPAPAVAAEPEPAQPARQPPTLYTLPTDKQDKPDKRHP